MYKPDNYTNLRDPLTPAITSDMFYYPKQVTSWDDQFDKWANTWLWQFTPVPTIVFWCNFWMWTVDFWTNVSEDKP